MKPTVLPFNYLREYQAHEDEILEVVRRVLSSGQLLLGPETEALEAELAEWIGAPHAVAVGSGTMALQLSCLALDIQPGDEVVTVANTCSPTVASFRVLGAIPVFVDVDPETLMMDTRMLERAISLRTRAVIPVHLWGSCPDLDRILEIADQHELPVIEDCAQSFGTTWKGRQTGNFGAFGCFSFYPTKNLGSYGDAGAIVTHDDEAAARLRRARMYGYGDAAVSRETGTNGRISELQAALLRWKLGRVGEGLEWRRTIARRYEEEIRNDNVTLPVADASCAPSWHQFVIRCERRDDLREHLKRNGVTALIHYPTPLHEMAAYRGSRCVPDGLPVTMKACETILSLPIHDSLEPDEITRVIAAVNAFGT